MSSFFKHNFFFVFFGIFALVGTGMGIAAAAIWLNGIDIANKGIHTSGTVTEMIRSSGSNTQAPVVDFVMKNGQRHAYTSNMFSSPPAYKIGESVELWYNPENPDEVLLSGMDRWFLPMIFGIFFLVFGGIGYGGIIYQLLKKRDVAWLHKNGQSIEANLTGVRLNTNVKMNGSSPYVIQCQWLDQATNKMYVFNSDDIWYDPSEYVKGETMRVLIDPKNPGLYVVDISFLPEEGN